MPLHFCLFTCQFLTFQFKAVVLRLEELELFFDAVQRLRDGEFERLARSLVRGRVPALGEHGSGRGGSPSQRGSRGETPRPAPASHPVRQGGRSGDTRRPPSLRHRGQERDETRLSAPAAGTSPSRGVLCCFRSKEG